MDKLPFSRPGRFWRGNLHMHSTLSDGRLSPEDACAVYREAGYDFVSLTDHHHPKYDYKITDSRPLRSDDFTTIIGAELHTWATEFGSMWHILAVGIPLDFAPTQPDETGPELANRALQAGAYVAVAHPQWHAMSEADVVSLGPVHAIEIYNATSADHNDRADSCYMLDLMLNRGKRYLACATDDAHFTPQRHDALRGWVMVKSESLAPDALLDALKAGHYYSSTGPQIHDITVQPGESLTVRCSPASRIFVTGRIEVARSVSGHGITHAEFDLSNFDSPFCRVTVLDAQNQRAWSNPIWF